MSFSGHRVNFPENHVPYHRFHPMDRQNKMYAGIVAWLILIISATEVSAYPWKMEPDGTEPAYFEWRTEPDYFYDLWQSTDLVEWNRVSGFPKKADGLSMGQALEPSPNGRRFFKVVTADEQPPMVVAQYPERDDFAVGRFDDIEIELSDATGIDPSSLRLQLPGRAEPLTLNSAGLKLSGNSLTYDSGTSPLGAWGETLLTTLIVKDTLGNTLTHRWSFRLESEPVINGSVFVFGSPSASSAGQKAVPDPKRALAPTPAASGNQVHDGDKEATGWSLFSVSPDLLIITYEPGHAPAFTVGQLVCNMSPMNESAIFYRRILSVTDNVASSQLTLLTENARLSEFVSQGSARISKESAMYEFEQGGAIARTLSFDGSLSFLSYGFDLSGAAFALREDGYEVSINGYSHTVGEADNALECELPKLSWSLTPRLRLALELESGSLKTFDAVMRGDLSISTELRGRAILPIASQKWQLYDLPERLERKRVVSFFIGWIPVFVVISLDFEVEAEASGEAAASFHALYEQDLSTAFGITYRKGTGLQRVQSFQNGTPVAERQVTGEGKLSCKLTLEPEIELLVYGLAGFEAGIEPAVEINATISTGVGKSEICLEANVDFVLEPAGEALEALGAGGNVRATIASWSYCDQFAFTNHPVSMAVKEGESASFSCAVDVPEGSGQPTYQWYHNGRVIPGETARSIIFHKVAYGHGGSYYVTATLDGVILTSEIAALLIQGNPVITAEFVHNLGVMADQWYSMGPNGYSDGITLYKPNDQFELEHVFRNEYGTVQSNASLDLKSNLGKDFLDIKGFQLSRTSKATNRGPRAQQSTRSTINFETSHPLFYHFRGTATADSTTITTIIPDAPSNPATETSKPFAYISLQRAVGIGYEDVFWMGKQTGYFNTIGRPVGWQLPPMGKTEGILSPGRYQIFVLTLCGYGSGPIGPDGSASIDFLFHASVHPPGPPKVLTQTVTGKSKNTVTFNGWIEPNGNFVTAKFQYAEFLSIYRDAPELPSPIGVGSRQNYATVSPPLEPGKTYKARLVALSETEVVNGNEIYFRLSLPDE